MENIIEKLHNIGKENTAFDNWNLEETLKLLELYHIISKQETNIFNLIYKFHGCDTWEDIFRDYDINYLRDKAQGVEIAIKEITEQIKENKT
jgi:hypothetical protein